MSVFSLREKSSISNYVSVHNQIQILSLWSVLKIICGLLSLPCVFSQNKRGGGNEEGGSVTGVVSVLDAALGANCHKRRLFILMSSNGFKSQLRMKTRRRNKVQ